MTPNQSKSFSSTDRTERRGLHAAIMNLPCVVPGGEPDGDLEAAWTNGYKRGHRAARHAAAELALESDAINAELLEALKLFIAAGFGHSTNFYDQGKAYDAAIEAIEKATA